MCILILYLYCTSAESSCLISVRAVSRRVPLRAPLSLLPLTQTRASLGEAMWCRSLTLAVTSTTATSTTQCMDQYLLLISTHPHPATSTGKTTIGLIIVSPVISLNGCYRKIIGYAYNGCGDTSDEPSGHGTHVSGTVIGNIAEANIETSKYITSIDSLYELYCWSTNKLCNYYHCFI